MPGMSLSFNAYLKDINIKISGYSYIDFTPISKLISKEDLNQIRSNIPFDDVVLRAIIGSDVLPMIYRNPWHVEPSINVVVGNSIFGKFLFGKLDAAGTPRSHSWPISVKNKNYQLGLELLISNYFEFDSTSGIHKHLTLSKLNAEKSFKKY